MALETGYPSVDKPWLKYYSKESIESPLPECSIYEYLVQNNRDYPDDIAINYLGHKITYGELFANIDQVAAAFIKAGVREKEIVTIALPCVPEALYCIYALNKIGAIANMIHPLAGGNETVNYLNEVDSKIAVIFDGAYQDVVEVIENTNVKKVVVVSPGDSASFAIKILSVIKNGRINYTGKFQKWNDFVGEGKHTLSEFVKRDAHDMSLISHTGGTTGEPKGVMCSDYAIIALIWQIGSALPHSRQERYLPVIPPFHNYSLINSMLEPLSFGFEVDLVPKYEPEMFSKYIKKYRPNHISSIPTYWEALFDIKDISKLDLSCLIHIYYGGEMMPKDTEVRLNNLLLSRGANHPLCKGLGSTEMTSVCTVTYDDCNDPGSVGIPLVKVNCKIVEPDTMTELSYGQEGEICFSGPTMMIGYYGHQDATDEIIRVHEDGLRWIHTGDLGYIKENGILYVSGRIKRILITRDRNGQGTKLFPDRIEKVINSYDDVELCCVIGVPDAERVNYPKAFVVTKGNRDIRKDIIKLCEDSLPEYMVPVVVEQVDDLPRTPAGKVDYRALEKHEFSS